MIHTVFLNESIFFNLCVDDNRVAVYNSMPTNLTSVVGLEMMGDRVLIKVLNQNFAYYDLNADKIFYLRPITKMELNYIFDYLGTKDPDDIRNISLLRTRRYGLYNVKTELHTHFLEMLTGEQLLGLLLEYTDYLYVDENYQLVGTLRRGGPKLEEHNVVYKYQLEENPTLFYKLAEQLSLSKFGSGTFDDLGEASRRRSNVITTAAVCYTDRNGGNPKDSNEVADARAEIYYRMLLLALERLKDNGVRYVEYSYSTRSAIERMDQCRKQFGLPENVIDFNLLFSLSRLTSDASKLDRYYSDLDELLSEGITKGFDLMGEESGLTKKDVENTADPTTFISVINRALSVLTKYNGTVLRIHAGENYDSRNNPLWTLKVIDKIVESHPEYKEALPEIRIGHGLHFLKSYTKEQLAEYAKLLKRYGVVVEINATSNYSLGNVKNLEDIPYDWYIENEIPIVLATDGAGMYLTSARQEKLIADSATRKTLDDIIDESESRYVGMR